MRNWSIWSLNLLAPVLAVSIGAALLFLDPPLLKTLRLAVFDQYQRLHPRA